GGRVTANFGGSDEGFQALVALPDGRVVAGGWSNARGGYDASLARYLPNGRLDPSFGRHGRVLLDFGGDGDGVNDLALQRDGRLVVLAHSNAGGKRDQFALAR